MNNLAVQLEALLFALGRPASHKELQKMLGTTEPELREALTGLSEAGRGIVLVDDGVAVELRIAGEASALVERVRKEEYTRDIGKAGMEALAAILYRGPLTRAEVDFIRGVNSSQTLRTLLMRGLVRKTPNPRDERSFLYEPTTELFAELGISRRSELPRFEELRKRLEELERAYRAHEEQENTERV